MIGSFIVLLVIIQSVALQTLAERKVMGAMQRRIGPNKVGIYGQLQPFTDGIKLIQKQTIQPQAAEASWLYQGAPYYTFYQAQQNWMVIPQSNNGIVIAELVGGGQLCTIAISEQGIYGVIYSGWASNSKYSFLGSQRSTAQMISYSVSLSVIILTVIFSQGTVDFIEIMIGQKSIALLFALQPIAFQFIISAIAEVNRAPFDLPEAESELVAGYQTEYSAVSFAYFFLAEYTNIIVISTIFGILFQGISFAMPLIFIMLWVRATLARLRFDQLLHLGWSHIQPFIIAYIMFLPPFIYTFDIVAL